MLMNRGQKTQRSSPPKDHEAKPSGLWGSTEGSSVRGSLAYEITESALFLRVFFPLNDPSVAGIR